MVHSERSVLPNNANKRPADRYATWTTRTAQNTVRKANEIVKEKWCNSCKQIHNCNWNTHTHTHTVYINLSIDVRNCLILQYQHSWDVRRCLTCTLHNDRHSRVANYSSRKSLTIIICTNKIHENLTFLSLLLPKSNKHYQSKALNTIRMHWKDWYWITNLSCPVQSRQKWVWGSVKRLFLAPSKEGPADNLYTKSERLTLTCGVTWSERFIL